jgi:hypothetical protein
LRCFGTDAFFLAPPPLALAMPRVEAGRDPNVNALLIQAYDALLPSRDGLAPLSAHAPLHIQAWVLDEVRYPSVAILTAPAEDRECPPAPLALQLRHGAPELARVYTAESAAVIGALWLAVTSRLDGPPAFALFGDATFERRAPPALGCALWPAAVRARLNAYAHDLGRAVAQLQYAPGGCDGTGLVVVLGRAREQPAGAGEAPWRLYVMVDPARCGPVDVATDADAAADRPLVDALAQALAHGAWLPLTRTADTVGEAVNYDESFRRGYREEAAQHGRALLAKQVLETVHDWL